MSKIQHPAWCAEGHHCAYPLRSGGHASLPEVFETRVGRVIATRHGSDAGGHLEVRIVVPLPDAPEVEREGFMRAVVAGTAASLADQVTQLRHELWLAEQRRAYVARAEQMRR